MSFWINPENLPDSFLSPSPTKGSAGQSINRWHRSLMDSPTRAHRRRTGVSIFGGGGGLSKPPFIPPSYAYLAVKSKLLPAAGCLSFMVVESDFLGCICSITSVWRSFGGSFLFPHWNASRKSSEITHSMKRRNNRDLENGANIREMEHMWSSLTVLRLSTTIPELRSSS